MANIDKIKEQGNQAAPLLTELHDNETQNELVISGYATGAFPNYALANLKGRQNILAMWDKLEKGEIKAEDIKCRILSVGDREASERFLLSFSISSKGEAKSFYITWLETGNTAATEALVFRLEYKREYRGSWQYVTGASCSKVTETSTNNNVTAEFID